MEANAIIESDGKTYTHWNVSLAVSQTMQADGSQPISVALRCVPVRLNDSGVTETLNSAAVAVYRGRAEEVTDPQEQAAFVAVQEALTTFLRARGL